jgi:hypothetical protein
MIDEVALLAGKTVWSVSGERPQDADDSVGCGFLLERHLYWGKRKLVLISSFVLAIAGPAAR